MPASSSFCESSTSYAMATTTTTVTKSSWQDVARIAQQQRDDSIARVDPPVPEVPAELPLDVSVLPKELLSSEEVEITQTAAEDLVASIASGKLSSVTVTEAFLRRAGLAQKLVCAHQLAKHTRHSADRALTKGQLRHRAPPRKGPGESEISRRISCRTQETNRTASWLTCQCQGAHWHERSRAQCRLYCLVG